MVVFVFNWTELIGYAGGICLAFASLPQVVHTYRTQSTRDISYGWQIATIVGLVLSYIYFILNQVTAAWVTLTVELCFALLLFAMKVGLDGFGSETKRERTSTKSIDSLPSDEESATGAASSSESSENGDSDDCIPSLRRHSLLKARVADKGVLPADFADMFGSAVKDSAARHGLPAFYHRIDRIRAQESRDTQQDFAMSVAMDQTFLSAYWSANQAELLVNLYHCNSKAEQAIVSDLFDLIQSRVSPCTKLMEQCHFM